MRTLDLRNSLLSVPSLIIDEPYTNGLRRYLDIEIIPISEKLPEIMQIYISKEVCRILFLDGIKPVIGEVVNVEVGKIVDIQMPCNDYIRATIRRTA